MKTFLFLLITTIYLFSGCKKKGEDRYTIKGQILISCTSIPFANKEISFFQRIGSDWVGQTSGGELGVTSTDASGNFSFSYDPLNDNEIRIQEPAGFGYSTIFTLSGKRNLENLKIRYGPVTTIQVKLNVTKAYSQNDTLYITDYRGGANFLKVSGPFSNSILYNAPNYGFGTSYDVVSSRELTYKIGNNGPWKSKSFDLVACDTSRVTVDIY